MDCENRLCAYEALKTFPTIKSPTVLPSTIICIGPVPPGLGSMFAGNREGLPVPTSIEAKNRCRRPATALPKELPDRREQRQLSCARSRLGRCHDTLHRHLAEHQA